MKSPNCPSLILDGDGHTIVVSFSTSRSNIATPESSQQLVTLFQQAKFWAQWDQKYAPWAFFKPNNDELVSLKTERVLCHIL
jgi:hypothetical protein